jgi:hypothetical protein
VEKSMNPIIVIQNEWDLDKIQNNLKNPKQGDTYIWHVTHCNINTNINDAVKIVIGLVKNKNLYYYKNTQRFKIPITELENIITSVYGVFEFYNQYEYQKYIEEEKLKQFTVNKT